jgi:hypothetical protein
MKRFIFILSAVVILAVSSALVARNISPKLRSAVFQIDSNVNTPTSGVFISQGYQARPNERGSVLLQAGENLTNFEGIFLTFMIDQTKAEILKVNRAAALQNFEMSVHYPVPGVVNVALVGNPRSINHGVSMLEFELDLAQFPANTINDVIPMQLLGVHYVANNTDMNQAHNGAIEIVTDESAAELGFVTFVSDVNPGIFPLVRNDTLVIRGKGFSSGSTVLLNNRPITIVSTSSTEIIANIPEQTLSGSYTISLGSLYADEKIVVFENPGASAPVDILEELMFLSPNPMRYSVSEKPTTVDLWIPIFNPLGAGEPVVGSVDFTSIGGSPNIGFGKTDVSMTDADCREDPVCIGEVAVGPGGVSIVWFKVTGNISDSLQTNTDYPITIRVENRAGKRDQEVETLELRTIVVQGETPTFGDIETTPMVPAPGDNISFYIDITDNEGVDSLQSVQARLTSLGGGIEELSPAISLPSGGAALTTVPYVLNNFTISDDIADGIYEVEFTVRDNDGNQTQTGHNLYVSSTGGGGDGVVSGNAPIFSGYLETFPEIASLGGDVTFYAGVSDLDGSDTIMQVTIDLLNIGGGVMELEKMVDPVSGSVQPVTYKGEYTMPHDLAPGLYSLRLQAFDSSGNSAVETLQVTVSAVIPSGGLPVIIKKSAVPNKLPANAESETFFSLEIEDADGIDDIEVVRLNLIPLGMPYTFMSHDSSSSSSDGTKGIFVSKKIKIPTTVKSAGYDIGVQIEDKQGNLVNDRIRLTIGELGGDAPEFLHNRFVPDVVPPGGETQLFVEVGDENGVGDQNLTVAADFTDIRLDFDELNSIINYPSDAVAKQNTFKSKKITIPEDLQTGVYNIKLTAVDDTGNTVYGGARLRVERGGADDGSAPTIRVNNSFQVPRVFANDGEEEGEIHVLVSDPDDDVMTVMANMGSFGRAGGSSTKGDNDIDLLCGSSMAIACMQRSVLENTGSRWFVLTDISIPSTTLASTEPYMIELTAIDEQGHTTHESVPIYIGDEGISDRLRIAPELVMIVPVDEDEFELVVSNPINTSSVERGGSQFTIRPTLDAFSEIEVDRVSWDTTGRVLYLESDKLIGGETYTFSVVSDSNPLTDIYGNRFSADRGGTLVFTGYERGRKAPEIERVNVIDSEHIDVIFATQVLPSSVHPDIMRIRASLESLVSGKSSRIKDAELSKDARTLMLTVDKIREGDHMRIKIPGVLAPGRIKVPGGDAEFNFIVAFARFDADEDGCLVLPTADLNRDGHINFSDFALLSSVYGTEYRLSDISILCPSSGEPNEQSENSRGPVQNSNLTKPIGSGRGNMGGKLPNFDF